MCTSVTTKGVPPELMTIASFQRPKTVQQRQHVLTGRNSKVAPKQMNQQEITNDIIIVSFLTKKCVLCCTSGDESSNVDRHLRVSL